MVCGLLMVCGLGKQRWRETLETMRGDFFGASRIFVLSGSGRMSLRPAPIVEKKLELELSVGWGGRARAGKVELDLSAVEIHVYGMCWARCSTPPQYIRS
jgi:hypothetical protein